MKREQIGQVGHVISTHLLISASASRIIFLFVLGQVNKNFKFVLNEMGGEWTSWACYFHTSAYYICIKSYLKHACTATKLCGAHPIGPGL